VVVVVEENHSLSSVIGNPAMPYLNSLASQYALATQYYANTHPSIGNYFEMTAGQIITNNDAFTSTVTADNIVRHLLGAGKTWKSYAEGLPSVGYTGGDTTSYTRHHNPFSYFSDVFNSSVERLNLVPMTQFAADLSNNHLPQFSFVVPNKADDAHDGTLAQADSWLKGHISPLLRNAAFQSDGILIIVFDESVTSDTAHGGGRVAAVIVGPKVKRGYKSMIFYQHQSLLRTVLQALGVGTFPGAGAHAPAMKDFFTP
jgi:phosphatidylinositol-3-phosphatase